MRSAFRACGICLFLLSFVFVRAASGQDSPIVRGPFGGPVGLYYAGHLTVPISVYEDSTLEILIPDITTYGFGLEGGEDTYLATGTYFTDVYYFYKGKPYCLRTAPQSPCVAYARYMRMTIYVNTRKNTVSFGDASGYYGERAQPLMEGAVPRGSSAISSLKPPLLKSINTISAIVNKMSDESAGGPP